MTQRTWARRDARVLVCSACMHAYAAAAVRTRTAFIQVHPTPSRAISRDRAAPATIHQPFRILQNSAERATPSRLASAMHMAHWAVTVLSASSRRWPVSFMRKKCHPALGSLREKKLGSVATCRLTAFAVHELGHSGVVLAKQIGQLGVGLENTFDTSRSWRARYPRWPTAGPQAHREGGSGSRRRARTQPRSPSASPPAAARSGRQAMLSQPSNAPWRTRPRPRP
jgi:hypothetical protein